MSNEDIVGSIFGWIGTLLSIYFYIAPVFPFIKVLKDQMSYENSSIILIVASFLNCILWADYGLQKDSTQIYISNSLGGTITLIWITIYLMYLGKKYFVLTLVINILLLIIMGVVSYVFYFIVNDYYTGLLAMIFNILMYAGAGEKIFQVIKTGNFELIPIFSTIGGFACSLCWIIFGIYQNDRNVIIPNALGLFFALIQAIIYLIYYCRQNNNNKKENIKDLIQENKWVNEKLDIVYILLFY